MVTRVSHLHTYRSRHSKRDSDAGAVAARPRPLDAPRQAALARLVVVVKEETVNRTGGVRTKRSPNIAAMQRWREADLSTA
jgi:hypothetical protein